LCKSELAALTRPVAVQAIAIVSLSLRCINLRLLRSGKFRAIAGPIPVETISIVAFVCCRFHGSQLGRGKLAAIAGPIPVETISIVLLIRNLLPSAGSSDEKEKPEDPKGKQEGLDVHRHPRHAKLTL
jgi:hypothetical protein